MIYEVALQMSLTEDFLGNSGEDKLINYNVSPPMVIAVEFGRGGNVYVVRRFRISQSMKVEEVRKKSLQWSEGR